MILKRMPGKVAKAALKFQFVKFKVGIDCLILGLSLLYANCQLSIRMIGCHCLCVFLVHSTDATRVDLTIPGEQYFYLRAINAAERQKWLVALGTAKACLTDNRTKREKGIWMSLYTNYMNRPKGF